jgi:hypothetical protein
LFETRCDGLGFGLRSREAWSAGGPAGAETRRDTGTTADLNHGVREAQKTHRDDAGRCLKTGSSQDADKEDVNCPQICRFVLQRGGRALASGSGAESAICIGSVRAVASQSGVDREMAAREKKPSDQVSPSAWPVRAEKKDWGEAMSVKGK